jgi:integrase
MCLQTNIARRGAVYYVRVGLPSELIQARAQSGLAKRTEVWKSLGTKDPKEARRIGPVLVARLQADFERELATLKRGDAPAPERARKLHKPTQAEIEAVAWEMLRVDLRADVAERDSEPSAERRAELIASVREKAVAVSAKIANPKQALLVATVESLDELTELDRANIRRDMRSIEREANAAAPPSDAFGDVAEAIIRERGWDVLPESPEYLRLCRVLASSRMHALKAIAARDDGDHLSTTANPEIPAPVASIGKRKKAKPGESLLELLPQYFKEEGARLSSEELFKKQKVVELFAEHVGKDRDVQTITRADLRNFKRALEHWPRTAYNQRQFKGKTFDEIVELNRKLGGRTIGPATVNNYLSSLGGYCNWLFANDYLSEPKITQGLLVKHNKAEHARESYSEAELQAIFALPVFTGCKASDDVNAPGDVRVTDWRFWIPVICLYTGARLGEIAQLRIQDVREVGGHWTLHITDDGEGMAVKTKGSVRIVPVHPELMRLGLIAYRQRIADSGSERLFPELTANEHGRYAASVSKWWRKYLQRFGVVGGNAYRFRHTFADALRTAGYMDNEIGPLLGHGSGTMTEKYGALPQVTVDRRAQMVADVRHPVALTAPKI